MGFQEEVAWSSSVLPEIRVLLRAVTATRISFWRTHRSVFHVSEIEPRCKGLAFDLISLYPSIMVFSEFPAGHPEINLHSFGDPSEYFGMVQCSILPPKDLWIPTLPLRLHDGRTLCSLCRTCSEEINIVKPCLHSANEKAFEGAWITPLLNQAVDDGYTIMGIFEVHHFSRRSVYNPATKCGGIFARFILASIQKKTVYSRFPSTISTDEEKRAYCREHE